MSEIQNDKRKRPFENKAPCILKFLFSLLRLFVLLIVLYVFFMILQLFLFNFVIVGFLIYFYYKAMQFTGGIYSNWKYNSGGRNKLFFTFIEDENKRYYDANHMHLIGGKEGLWIEIKLPFDKVDIDPGAAKIQDQFNEYTPNERKVDE